MKIHHSSIALLEQKGSMGFKKLKIQHTPVWMHGWFQLVSTGEPA